MPLLRGEQRESKLMELNPISSNRTEIKAGQWTILFSYRTPVAAYSLKTGYLKTEKKWSRTTSKHIGQWAPGCKFEERPQSFFDNIAAKA